MSNTTRTSGYDEAEISVLQELLNWYRGLPEVQIDNFSKRFHYFQAEAAKRLAKKGLLKVEEVGPKIICENFVPHHTEIGGVLAKFIASEMDEVVRLFKAGILKKQDI